MHLVPYPSRDDPRVVKTARVLRDHFPEVSEAHAGICAVSLVHSLGWEDQLYHAGARDRTALEKLTKSILKASEALDEFSNWSLQALDTALHQIYMDPYKSDLEFSLPVTREELVFTFKSILRAARNAEEMRDRWRAGHGKNTKAILLIEEARITWKVLSKRGAPTKRLNLETRFGRFLVDVFDAVGIHLDLPNAYRAWSELAHDRLGPFELP